MDWKNLPQDTSQWFGFVYLITRTNAADNEQKYYIGCKQFHSKVRRPPLKGLKRKRTIVKDSDYKNYYGSSEDLKRDVEKYGKESFERSVLHLCETKWSMKFTEAIEQLTRGVLFNDRYYNGIIHIRLGKVPKALKSKLAGFNDQFFVTQVVD